MTHRAPRALRPRHHRYEDIGLQCGFSARTAQPKLPLADGTRRNQPPSSSDCAAAGHLPALPRTSRGRSVARDCSGTRSIFASGAATLSTRHVLPVHVKAVRALQLTRWRQAPASRCGPSPHPAPSSATFAQYLCAQPCGDAPAVEDGSIEAGFTGCPARVIENPRRPLRLPLPLGRVPMAPPCPTDPPTASSVEPRPLYVVTMLSDERTNTV